MKKGQNVTIYERKAIRAVSGNGVERMNAPYLLTGQGIASFHSCFVLPVPGQGQALFHFSFFACLPVEVSASSLLLMRDHHREEARCS